MAFAESPETSMEESFGYITGGFESIQSRKIEGVRVLIAYVENLAALVSLYNSNFANTALRSGQKQNKFCKIFLYFYTSTACFKFVMLAVPDTPRKYIMFACLYQSATFIASVRFSGFWIRFLKSGWRVVVARA